MPSPAPEPELLSASPSASADDADAVAERPLWDYPATYGLIAVNLAVYAAMYRWGPIPPLLAAPAPVAAHWRASILLVAGMFSAPFSSHVLIVFGACAPDQILAAGEWWRLLSSIFVHVTLLHLLLNLWCLWNLGVFGEPLLGKAGMVAVYLLTGATGMLQSVISAVSSGHLQLISAGASGAVFGIAGILIVLLSSRKLGVPPGELRFLRWQVIFFALINLLLGELPVWLPRLLPGMWQAMRVPPGALPVVDNSAHVGGLLCGLVLGLLLFPRMTSGRSSYRARQAMVFSSAALLLALVSYAVAVFARGVTA